MRWVILAIGMAVATTGFDAAAAGKKSDGAAFIKDPTHIQMVPMMLPVGNTSAPMTLFLEAVKRNRVENICKRMPKVRDALLRVLSRDPIPLKKRKMLVKGAEKKLLKPLNKAVGKKYIKRVFITPGAVKMGAGKIPSQRFAVIDGCHNILRSELEKQQAAKAAGQ